mmetsp:Transcript_34554/g.86804  ORF Transcript_34554/g.86804 Transcript_34554/m.86804 type:complete len:227 (-) Transcript_34554:1010-1690(-)
MVVVDLALETAASTAQRPEECRPAPDAVRAPPAAATHTAASTTRECSTSAGTQWAGETRTPRRWTVAPPQNSSRTWSAPPRSAHSWTASTSSSPSWTSPSSSPIIRVSSSSSSTHPHPMAVAVASAVLRTVTVSSSRAVSSGASSRSARNVNVSPRMEFRTNGIFCSINSMVNDKHSRTSRVNLQSRLALHRLLRPNYLPKRTTSNACSTSRRRKPRSTIVNMRSK